MVEQKDLVGKGVGLCHHVGGDEDRAPLALEAPHVVPDAVRALHVHAERRLVEQQDARIGEHRAPEREATLHAARVGAHGILRPVGQVDELEHLVDAALRRALVVEVERGVEAQVLQRRKLRVERRLLRHEPDLAAHLPRVAHGVEPQHPHRARRRAVQPGDEVHERRLARAVRPQKPVDHPRLAREREALNARLLPEHLRHVVEDDDAFAPHGGLLRFPINPTCVV